MVAIIESESVSSRPRRRTSTRAHAPVHPQTRGPARESGVSGRRFYQPDTGRWCSRDPIGEQAGLNLHGFVGNTPISLVDPVGLETYGFTLQIAKPALITWGSVSLNLRLHNVCERKLPGSRVVDPRLVVSDLQRDESWGTRTRDLYVYVRFAIPGNPLIMSFRSPTQTQVILWHFKYKAQWCFHCEEVLCPIDGSPVEGPLRREGEFKLRRFDADTRTTEGHVVSDTESTRRAVQETLRGEAFQQALRNIRSQHGSQVGASVVYVWDRQDSASQLLLNLPPWAPGQTSEAHDEQ